MTEQKKAQYKVIGGSVVLLPPEDDAQAEAPAADVALETSKGAITVKVEGDKDVSQVTDAESEALSNENAAKVREENQKAAEEAQVSTQPRRAGDSVVAGGTFNDIDLPEYEEAQKKREEALDAKTKEAEKAAEVKAEKQAEAEEQFQADLAEVFAEQSEEEFVEGFEEDE